MTRFLLQGIQFEWDEEKGHANERKHGVGFETACEVFFDPFLRLFEVTDDAGELREAVIGLTVDWHLLYVVYTERECLLRTISARPVVAVERKYYEEH